MTAEALLEKECGGKAFLVPSCTAALELACMMILEPGDEVIMPSWTFPSCANAVILRGGIPVFVDVDENLHIDKISAAITDKTKAIMPVHYAGVVCDMKPILALADAYGLYVIEDAAQAIGNWTVAGDFGCLSFHYTKNVQCGQGGALIVNNSQFIEKAEMMMHCGTTKAKFYRGETEGYEYLDVGSQYVMSPYQESVLKRNLEKLKETTDRRRDIWAMYRVAFDDGIRANEMGNGHIFWWFMDNKWDYIKQMRDRGIKISSHYDALHTTIPGKKYGRIGGFGISRAVEAMDNLVKLDTGVSEEEAKHTCEILWHQKNVL